MGEAVEFLQYSNGFCKMNGRHEIDEGLLLMNHGDYPAQIHQESWFEEEIDVDLKWSFALNRFVMCLCVYRLRFLTYKLSKQVCHVFMVYVF